MKKCVFISKPDHQSRIQHKVLPKPLPKSERQKLIEKKEQQKREKQLKKKVTNS
jgi:hypothetical protein